MDDPEIWIEAEKQVINACLGRNIKKDIIEELFYIQPIGKRLRFQAQSAVETFKVTFSKLFDKLEAEYEEWKKEDKINLEALFGMKVTKTEVIIGETPLYILTLNDHGSLQLSGAELMYQGKFLLKFLMTFHRKPKPLEPDAWQRLTGYWLESIEKTESEMVSQTGAIYEFLDEFTSEVSDDEKEQLARLRLGEVVEYEKGIAFRSEAFRKYLEKMKLNINKIAIFRILREIGWKPIMVGPTEERIRCWWRPETKSKDELKDVDTLLKTDDSFSS